MNKKVFCIEFPKTGTSSLAIALIVLNYKACRRLRILQEKLSNNDLIESLKREEYDEILDVTE
jgi:hypothetical protein